MRLEKHAFGPKMSRPFVQEGEGKEGAVKGDVESQPRRHSTRCAVLQKGCPEKEKQMETQTETQKIKELQLPHPHLSCYAIPT